MKGRCVVEQIQTSAENTQGRTSALGRDLPARAGDTSVLQQHPPQTGHTAALRKGRESTFAYQAWRKKRDVCCGKRVVNEKEGERGGVIFFFFPF